MRIGYGFCAARTKEKDDHFIVLGGVKIDWRVGLQSQGECDRDVAALAAADALLGAMGLGSLNCCTEASFDTKNTPGVQVLEQAAQLMERRGFCLGNMDLLVVLQDVRFANFLPQVKENLCRAMGCAPDCLNVKIENEQWLGYTGSTQGINARAVCLLQPKNT